MVVSGAGVVTSGQTGHVVLSVVHSGQVGQVVASGHTVSVTGAIVGHSSVLFSQLTP